MGWLMRFRIWWTYPLYNLLPGSIQISNTKRLRMTWRCTDEPVLLWRRHTCRPGWGVTDARQATSTICSCRYYIFHIFPYVYYITLTTASLDTKLLAGNYNTKNPNWLPRLCPTFPSLDAPFGERSLLFLLLSGLRKAFLWSGETKLLHNGDMTNRKRPPYNRPAQKTFSVMASAGGGGVLLCRIDNIGHTCNFGALWVFTCAENLPFSLWGRNIMSDLVSISKRFLRLSVKCITM